MTGEADAPAGLTPFNSRLADLYERVLDNAEKDHESALMFARKYGEAYCRELGAGTGGGPEARPRSLDDLLKEVIARNLAPQEVRPHLRAIQYYGNTGAHEHAAGPLDLSAEDILPCVSAVVALHGRYVNARAQQRLSLQIAAPERPAEVRVASSRLTVVSAIELGWKLDVELQRHGLNCRTLAYPWSDRILDDLAAERLDLAIYNRVRADAAISAGAAIARLGTFGFSMGGRNFYILAREGSHWALAPRETLLADLRDATIAVPYGSDIAENVALALGTSPEMLQDRGIRLFPIPANAGLDIFQVSEDILVSAGQNLRMLARFSGGYEEVLGFEMLADDVKKQLIRRSENCLLASKAFIAAMRNGADADLFERLRRNFLISWTDSKTEEKLVQQLASLIELDGITIDAAEEITRAILFESYRIGRP